MYIDFAFGGQIITIISYFTFPSIVCNEDDLMVMGNNVGRIAA